MSTPTKSVSRVASLAQEYNRAGLSIIPIGNTATKTPALESWRDYSRAAPSADDLAHWFTDNGTPAFPALAIVTGKVSGNLTVLDFDVRRDGRTCYPDWCALVEHLAPGLVAKLPHVRTPSGGHHVYLCSDVVEGNTKLATASDRRTWIETRGEGGYIMAPPSAGYTLLSGRLDSIPLLTEGERSILLHAARALGEQDARSGSEGRDADSLPGTVYSAYATVEHVQAVLTGAGWSVEGTSGENTLMRRPGKRAGTSGTIRKVNGLVLFYVFSSNAAPFEPGRAYSPFAVLAHCQFGGDFAAAARSLAARGEALGVAPAPPRPSPSPEPPPPPKPAPPAPLKRLKDLLARDMPDLPFAVPGIVPDGLFLLAGAPKTGKSLMCLGMALGIAQGGYALGTVKVEKRPVIYYVLEDGERLFRKRALRMLEDAQCPEDFYYRDEFPRLDHGALEAMQADLAAVPGALLVVDTFQRIRPRGSQGMDAYQNDANGLEPLAKWVVASGITCILVHHTTKQQAGDFLADVSGSFGLTGTAGAIGVLKRTRHERELKLLLSGRAYDEDQELIISYEPATLQHTLMGTADEVGASHIEHLIIDSLKFTREPMAPRELLAANPEVSIDGINKALRRLLDAGRLEQNKYGYYCLPAGQGGPHSVHSVHSAVDCATPGDDGGDPPCSRASVGQSVQSVQSREVEPAPTSPEKGAVPVTIQQAPCAGCGKRHTKRPARYDQAVYVCGHCGVEAPMA